MFGKVRQPQAIAITIFFALQTVLSIARPEEITAAHGVVATDVGTCSRIGRDVLQEGGHAVDAVVAAAFCLGVVSPASSGIGGGAFMLLRLANGDAQAFDMRENAPFSSSMNMYAGNATLKTSGALSIAVPGEVAGLHEAWKQHGKLPWKRLVMPATRLAHRGFRISPYLFMQMNKTKAGILADEGLSNMFTSKGKLLRPGDTCYNKRLARTLRAISKHGPQILYDGSVGKDLVRDIQKFGGILTMKDLQKYKVRVTEPISAEIMGLKILGMPPPSAGGAGIILMLNILARYGIPSGVSGSLGIHRFIESLKHVFAVRMNLGDPEFVNVSEVLSDMLSPKFAEELSKTIDDNMTFNLLVIWVPLVIYMVCWAAVLSSSLGALFHSVPSHFGDLCVLCLSLRWISTQVILSFFFLTWYQSYRSRACSRDPVRPLPSPGDLLISPLGVPASCCVPSFPAPASFSTGKPELCVRPATPPRALCSLFAVPTSFSDEIRLLRDPMRVDASSSSRTSSCCELPFSVASSSCFSFL